MKAYHGGKSIPNHSFFSRANIYLAEVALVFGTINSVRQRDPEPYELQAQDYLQEAWVAFIKNPRQGLKDFGWPSYNPNSKSIKMPSWLPY